MRALPLLLLATACSQTPLKPSSHLVILFPNRPALVFDYRSSFECVKAATDLESQLPDKDRPRIFCV